VGVATKKRRDEQRNEEQLEGLQDKNNAGRSPQLKTKTRREYVTYLSSATADGRADGWISGISGAMKLLVLVVLGQGKGNESRETAKIAAIYIMTPCCTQQSASCQVRRYELPT
jgi:hypothetical protein